LSPENVGSLRSHADNRKHLSFGLGLIVALLLTWATSCKSEHASAYPWYVEDMKAAKTRWIAEGPRCYRMTIRRTDGMSPVEHRSATVCEHHVRFVTELGDDGLTRPALDDDQRMTVDAIFAEIDDMLTRAPLSSVRATYDTRFGFPTTVRIISNKFAYDTSSSIAVEALEPIDCADCTEEVTDPKPLSTSICSIIANPIAYADRLVSVDAWVLSDGLHGTSIFDKSCIDGGIALTDATPSGEHNGIDDFDDALYRGSPGTIDKEIRATFVGTFRWQPRTDRASGFSLLRVSNMKVFVKRDDERARQSP